MGAVAEVAPPLLDLDEAEVGGKAEIFVADGLQMRGRVLALTHLRTPTRHRLALVLEDTATPPRRWLVMVTDTWTCLFRPVTAPEALRLAREMALGIDRGPVTANPLILAAALLMLDHLSALPAGGAPKGQDHSKSQET